MPLPLKVPATIRPPPVPKVKVGLFPKGKLQLLDTVLKFTIVALLKVTRLKVTLLQESTTPPPPLKAIVPLLALNVGVPEIVNGPPSVVVPLDAVNVPPDNVNPTDAKDIPTFGALKLPEDSFIPPKVAVV